MSRFAFAITVLNIAGHLFLGFEQSWATPFVALAAGYGTDLIGETIDARANGRRPRYSGSFVDLVRFLLPAHISALAVGMLLYASQNLAAVAFGVSVAMASKYVFRVVIGIDRQGHPLRRHFLNPSNFGITLTLVLFPSVGIAPPYQFAENTYGFVDWLLPLIVIGTGSLLNLKATERIPLILAWVCAFAAQAAIRAAIDTTPLAAGLMPMTGFAFVLFTFYMITDPATTPARRPGQIAFAVAVAAAYAMFMELHVVFGLFYALTLVTAGRGLWLFVKQLRASAAAAQARTPSLTPAE
ncbi:MAG: enediyne biosynthesis protein UnbU [Proteobacteria bacterium]|nr:enediyne biosynthesis protein UnbU [Pseudomonadota bacterium]